MRVPVPGRPARRRVLGKRRLTRRHVIAATRNPTTGNKHFVLEPGARFRTGGEDFTYDQVADEIRDEGWAAVNDRGDVIAGPDRESVARSARRGPQPSAGLAAQLES